MVEGTIEPCAGCGAKTNYIEIDVSPYSGTSHWVLCGGTCALVGPSCKTEADAIAAWNALSNAAALARAVEVLGNNEAHYQIAYHPDANAWAATHNDWETDVWVASPAAALIALAEQIEDTP